MSDALLLLPLDAPWTLRGGGAELAGQGLMAGLRKLWRRTLDGAIDDRGDAQFPAPMLELSGLVGPGRLVAVAVLPQGNSTLLRLRAFVRGARGPLVLEQLAASHLRLLQASPRWSSSDPELDPAAESLTPLTLASLLDEPEALMRALKPGH
jgi:hypothetical protein